MLFNSTTFLFIFLPSLMILYFLPVFKNSSEKNQLYRNVVLLVFSIGFYWWGEPVFVFVMLFSVLVNWILVKAMEQYESYRKTWFAAAVIFNVLILFVYKYLGFVIENISWLAGKECVVFSIALPIGISFYTFQILSYVFDVYYRKVEAEKNLFRLALYAMLFPQLVAGPIVRYSTVKNEIDYRPVDPDDFEKGVRRFIYGLAKKVLIADYISQISDNAFDYATNPTVLVVWLGALVFALVIYYDFSSYSDMAIGLGMMFGFHFPENFNYPYTAKTVADFWKKWHMSLTSWFRDYVYIPLGGNRVSKKRWIINVFIVWTLTGIWHGAEWTFVIWGIFYSVIIVIEKSLTFRKPVWFSEILTVLAVVLGWVIFRSSSLTDAFMYIGNMFGLGGNEFVNTAFGLYLEGTWPVLAAALIGCTPLIKNIFSRMKDHKLGFIEDIWLIIILLVSIVVIMKNTYNPFIYFNF